MQGRIDEDPRSPKDVAATNSLIGTGFSVSWNIPSNRPADTVTGYCVVVTHTESADFKEHCRTGSSTSWAATGCVTDYHCTGTFDIKVAFRNNCELEDYYSASISHTYRH